MALIRLLDFALLSFLVWMVWSQVIRGWRAAHLEAAARRQSGAAAGGPADPAQVNLVRCTACGVHVPGSRILPGAAGEVFCSEACRARAAHRQA